jgi:hypothetical protein
MNSLWNLLYTIKQPEEPRETKHTGENCLHRLLYHHEPMVEAFQANGMSRIDKKHSLAPVSPRAMPLIIDGSAYGKRLSGSAGVRRRPQRAQFLDPAFAGYRQYMLFFVGVAVRVAVQANAVQHFVML